jgi:hypothetical protein
MIPPQAGAAPAVPLPLARILGASRFGLGPAGAPPRWPPPYVVGHACGCLHWRSGRGRRVLPGQLTRLAAHTPGDLRGHPAVAVLHRDAAAPAVSLPAAGLLVLGPSRLCDHEGSGRWLTCPRCALLAAGPGARHSRDESALGLETDTPRAATRRLTVRDDAAHPLSAYGQTLLHGSGSFHTRAAGTSTHAEAQGDTSSPTHAQTAEDVLEVVPTVLARPVSRPRCPRCLWGLRSRPLEHHGRGVGMEPGRRDGVDCARFEGKSAADAVESGRQQGSEDRPAAVVRKRDPRAPRLQHRDHATRFQPSPSLVAGMLAIQHGEHHSCNPAPRREDMRRLGREKAVDNGGDFQTPSDSQDQWDMCHGMHLLDGHGHAAPPVVASPAASERHTVSGHSSALRPSKNRVVQPGPLNVGCTTSIL